MKKILLISIFIIIISDCFSYVSFAYESGTVYLIVSKENILKEDDFELKLEIKDSKVAAFNTYIYFDDTKVEYVSGPNYANVVGDKVICVWYDELGGDNPKSGELAEFKFKAKEKGIVNFSIDGDFYDEDENLLETKFQKLNIVISDNTDNTLKNEIQNNSSYVAEQKVLENIEIEKEQIINTNLENLAVENFLLNPAFDANITNYEIEISNRINTLNILAVPEKEDSNVKITGNQDLKEGENLIKIIVTDKNNLSEKVYEIKAIKRTVKEEKTYTKGQEKDKEKLKKIYETEKLQKEEENKPQKLDVKKDETIENSSKSSMITWLLVILFFTILGIYIIRVLGK